MHYLTVENLLIFVVGVLVGYLATRRPLRR
jgi:hypothetical protein